MSTGHYIEHLCCFEGWHFCFLLPQRGFQIQRLLNCFNFGPNLNNTFKKNSFRSECLFDGYGKLPESEELPGVQI